MRDGGSKESAYLIAIYPEQRFRNRRVLEAITSSRLVGWRVSTVLKRIVDRPLFIRRARLGDSLQGTTTLSFPPSEFSYPNSARHRAMFQPNAKEEGGGGSPLWREQTFEENKVTSRNRTSYSPPPECKRPLRCKNFRYFSNMNLSFHGSLSLFLSVLLTPSRVPKYTFCK